MVRRLALACVVVSLVLSAWFVGPVGAQNPARLFGTLANGQPVALRANDDGSLISTFPGGPLTAVTDVTFGAAGTLRTGTTATNTLVLQGYDTDGAAYANLLTLTASTAPTLALPKITGPLEVTGAGVVGGTLTVSGAGAFYPLGVTANTGTATPSAATDTNRLYTNTGDTDGSIVTLPNDPVVGTVIRVAVTAAQTITINPSAGEAVYLNGMACSVAPAASSGAAISALHWLHLKSIVFMARPPIRPRIAAP
jgi:hypothetical protein